MSVTVSLPEILRPGRLGKPVAIALLFGLILVQLTGCSGGEPKAIEVNDQPYLALRDVAKTFGLRYQHLDDGKRVQLSDRHHTLSFTLHHRAMPFDGTPVWLGFPVAAHEDRLYISQADIDTVLRPLLKPRTLPPPYPPAPKHIIIDPGHGGKDPGAENRALGINEKTTVLDLARQLKRNLENAGYRVTLLRTGDYFIPLPERAARANALEGDLFLSLHFNAAENDQVSGLETFVIPPPGHPSTQRATPTEGDQIILSGNNYDAWNLLAAFSIQQAMVDDTGRVDRGVKRARFIVLRDLTMPGVLIEGGFLSNPDEARLISTPAYREKIAEGIARGVIHYHAHLKSLPDS